jgi:hypothetical protein
MALFCALLAGFFLWVLLRHWQYATLTRARESAGPLLIEVKAGRKVRQKAQMPRIPFAIAMTLMWLWIAYLQFSLPNHSRTLVEDFVLGCNFFTVLVIAFPHFRRDLPLQLRERGVLRRQQSYEQRPGRLTFTPWEEIVAYKWCEELPQHYVQTQHLLLESGSLSPAEIEAVTKVAARFVPVCDDEGRLMAAPEAWNQTPRATGGKRGDELKFQFTLQTLLLLTVVVSCAASCYGIHYRHSQPQEEAVAQLGRPGLQFSHRGDDVSEVDFSTCAVKPSDNDLAQLARLPNLDHLNLEGTPITDAGLKHLYSLKKLRYIRLSNTKITRKGLDDLEKALPNAGISCYPPPPAMVPINKK